MPLTRPPRILAIAGSDSSGGAGVQADIKTITMLGGYAMTAITAVTAQNTTGVQAIHPITQEMLRDQFLACETDIGFDAIKIGMLGSPGQAEMVWDLLIGQPDGMPIVFDPVMVATSGSVLAGGETVEAFRQLMDLSTLVTPNLPELEALGGIEGVLAHCPAVLVKGGHSEGGTIVDRLVTRDGEVARWEGPRIDTRHTHGTGCTLSSAIATLLGKGQTLEEAITGARAFVRAALEAAPGFGAGHGPMGHHAVR
jgi:hydroxymethylpyrimidine/phosphomethylpyrimidine kinase